MIRTSVISLASVVLAATTSVRAVAVYGQCGGSGYTGSTVCDSGSTCTYSNEWYSQCLPSTAATTTKATTTSKAGTTTSKPATTTTKTSAATTTTASSSGVKYWFSFGDSYTQTGFDITLTKPAVGNPLGNPTYPGYTACGSVTNWIDLDTTTYNGNTQVLTYNFAYGGATIDATLVTPYTPTVQSMTDQVNIFLNNVGSKPTYAPWASSNTLFSFFIGINDIGNSWYQSGDRAAFSDTLLNAYFALVQKIYNVGGRNFLFINVPGVDRSPAVIAGGASNAAAEKVVIDGFNTKLTAKIAAFKAANSGVTTFSYDANAKLVQILNNPTAYGFKDATSYGSDANEAWCNDYHISSGVHTYYAQDIAAVLKSGGFFT